MRSLLAPRGVRVHVQRVPELKREEVEELVDLNSFRDLINAVLGNSGFDRLATEYIEGGAAVQPGEPPSGSRT